MHFRIHRQAEGSKWRRATCWLRSLIYRDIDTRARVLRRTCHEVLDAVGKYDDHVMKKRLYPNKDFYSTLALRAMVFAPIMFVVFFAVARTVGWIETLGHASC